MDELGSQDVGFIHRRTIWPILMPIGGCLDITYLTRRTGCNTSFPSVQVVVALFDTSSFTTLARLPTGATSLNQLTWLSDSRTLLAATADGRLMKWQGIAPPPAAPLSQQRLLTPGDFEAAEIAASQLHGGGDAGGECMAVSSRRAVCRSFAVDEQREFIAAGGPDGMLRLWPLHWQVRPWALCFFAAALTSLEFG